MTPIALVVKEVPTPSPLSSALQRSDSLSRFESVFSLTVPRRGVESRGLADGALAIKAGKYGETGGLLLLVVGKVLI